MKPLLLLLALMIPAPGVALAQAGPYADETRCSEFVELEQTTQLQLLSQIAPFGDDIGPDDNSGSEEWAQAVTGACAGHPDMTLTAAARAALTE